MNYQAAVMGLLERMLMDNLPDEEWHTFSVAVRRRGDELLFDDPRLEVARLHAPESP